MGYTPKQIGWSQESILLQQILKQLVRINGIAGRSSTPVTTTTTTTIP